jgi:Flp pilus assembly protein TadD
VPSFQPSLRIRALPGPQQVAALRAGAERGGAHAKILYGTALQQLGRPVSAEREFVAAAGLAPDDPDARVAEAVGRFDKAEPARAFGALGPLTRVFPQAQTVRFHLGLLLLWSAQVKEARKQLLEAKSEAPNSLLGRQATQYLAALGRIGTG